MYFSSIPEAYAPIGAPLRYALSEASAEETVVRIRTAAGELLGTKRFVGSSEPSFDIAPYLRSWLRFAPERGSTGFAAALDRCCTVVVEAESGTGSCRSAARTLLAADRTPTAPSLLTALPATRLLAPDEEDEVTLLAAAPMRITVTAEPQHTLVGSFLLPAAGLYRFRLAAADFPAAEQLTVDAEGCGTLRYTLLPAPDGAQRIAWRSRCGSIEHYTFPVVQQCCRSVSKSRSCGAEGLQARTVTDERSLLLRSAYEVGAVIDALSELLSAEQVWRVDAGGYHPVDVLTERAEYGGGELRTLTLTLRSTLPNERPWSC